jgi:hypothetical protein
MKWHFAAVRSKADPGPKACHASPGIAHDALDGQGAYRPNSKAIHADDVQRLLTPNSASLLMAYGCTGLFFPNSRFLASVIDR